MGNMEAKVFKASNLLDLLHKIFSGVVSVYRDEHSFFLKHSYPKAM